MRDAVGSWLIYAHACAQICSKDAAPVFICMGACTYDAPRAADDKACLHMCDLNCRACQAGQPGLDLSAVRLHEFV